MKSKSFNSSLYILNYKLYILNSFLLIISLLFLSSCKHTTEPKLKAELRLELEDVSCTEAWIKLTTTNLSLPTAIYLLKDGNVARNISLSSADTLLYVDSLLPNKSYRFDVALVTPTSPQPTT
ncbi:MAG: hypothetical protein N2043_06290, partial [Ignavibacterium sp.]|nr:hypothetical protein [Ignavibacterium sp.]